MKITDIPEQVPIMTLPNVILFPQALLPLYIFEPRYRQMLKDSLEHQRMFAVALTAESTEPRTIGGIGLIRACVDKPDGTSNLILQGVSRVRFTNFTQQRPYYVGKIELLNTEFQDGVEVDALAAKVMELLGSTIGEHQPANGIMKLLSEKVYGEYKDYDALADIVTYSFIDSVARKQEMLETLDLRQRLHKIVRALQEQGELI